MDSVLRRRMEIGFASLLLAVFVLLFVVGLAYPPRPRELPLLVDAAAIVLVLAQLVAAIRKPAVPGKKVGAAWNFRAVFLAVGVLVLYLISTLIFGMVLSSAIIVYGCGMAFGAKSKVRMAVVTVITVICIYFLFVVALGVPLYTGWIVDHLF